jgi:hypothetical protein
MDLNGQKMEFLKKRIINIQDVMVSVKALLLLSKILDL